MAINKQIHIPSTREEFLELMQEAFEAGKNSVESELRQEHFGTWEYYIQTNHKYNFSEWCQKIWKYGLKDHQL